MGVYQCHSMSLRYFLQPIYIVPSIVFNQGNESQPPFLQHTHTNQKPWFKRGLDDGHIGTMELGRFNTRGLGWTFLFVVYQAPFSTAIKTHLALRTKSSRPWLARCEHVPTLTPTSHVEMKPCAMLIADHQKWWFWQVDTIPFDSCWLAKIGIASYMFRVMLLQHPERFWKEMHQDRSRFRKETHFLRDIPTLTHYSDIVSDTIWKYILAYIIYIYTLRHSIWHSFWHVLWHSI